MATIKVACPKCGQKVSGDEHFYGAVVECPICSADIHFPGEKRDRPGYGEQGPIPIPPRSSASAPAADSDADTLPQTTKGKGGEGQSGGRRSAEEALGREVPVSTLPSASHDERNERNESGRRSSERPIDLTAASPRRERPLAAAATSAPPRRGSDGDASDGDGDEGEIPSAFCGAVSLVSAVLGVVTCVFGAIFCPVAIIFGHLSQAKARRSPMQPAPGQALGAAGLMIGYVWLFVTILILALAVLFKEALGEFFAGHLG